MHERHREGADELCKVLRQLRRLCSKYDPIEGRGAKGVPHPSRVLCGDKLSVVNWGYCNIIRTQFLNTLFDVIPNRIGFDVGTMDRNANENSEISACTVIVDLILN